MSESAAQDPIISNPRQHGHQRLNSHPAPSQHVNFNTTTARKSVSAILPEERTTQNQGSGTSLGSRTNDFVCKPVMPLDDTSQARGGNSSIASVSLSSFPLARLRAKQAFDSSDSDAVPTDKLPGHATSQLGRETLEQHDATQRVELGYQLRAEPSQRVECEPVGSQLQASVVKPNSGSGKFKAVIRKALDAYFDQGKITNRQYKRILQRAGKKVQDGLMLSSLNEKRVVKLVADYVEAYRFHPGYSHNSVV